MREEYVRDEAGQVTFSWRPLPVWSERFVVAIQTNEGELCRAPHGSRCQADLPEGEYTWWFEVLDGEQRVYESQPYVLHVAEP